MENSEDKPVSLFEILHVDRAEIRHSNFLAYLFDYKANGEIGKKFMQEFLNRLRERKRFPFPNDPFTSPLLQNGAFPDDISHVVWDVYREDEYLDLTIVFPQYKSLIVIENKTESAIHDSLTPDNKKEPQPIAYQKKIETNWKGWSLLSGVVLEPFGQNSGFYINPKNKENSYWALMNYDDILSFIRKCYKDEVLPKEGVIAEYCSVIERRNCSSTQANALEFVSPYFESLLVGKTSGDYLVFTTPLMHDRFKGCVSKEGERRWLANLSDLFFFTLTIKKEPYLLQLWLYDDVPGSVFWHDTLPLKYQRSTHNTRYSLVYEKRIGSQEDFDRFVKNDLIGIEKTLSDSFSDVKEALHNSGFDYEKTYSDSDFFPKDTQLFFPDFADQFRKKELINLYCNSEVFHLFTTPKLDKAFRNATDKECCGVKELFLFCNKVERDRSQIGLYMYTSLEVFEKWRPALSEYFPNMSKKLTHGKYCLLASYKVEGEKEASDFVQQLPDVEDALFKAEKEVFQ